jgi:hypothetical protein
MQYQVESRQRPRLRCFGVLLGLALSVVGIAQVIFERPRDYPHFRGALGLPGGFFSIDWAGIPSRGGAITLSTPLGIPLKEGEMVAGLGSVSVDKTFRLPSGERGDNQVNGDVWLTRGFEWSDVRFSLGVRWISVVGEHVTTVQVGVPTSFDARVKLSVGSLDPFGAGAAFASEDTRTVFAAATTRLGSAFVTAGWGTLRFKQGFASVSGEVYRGVSAVVEHDGFGFNVGIGVELDRHWHLFAGRLRDRNAVLGSAIRF